MPPIDTYVDTSTSYTDEYKANPTVSSEDEIWRKFAISMKNIKNEETIPTPHRETFEKPDKRRGLTVPQRDSPDGILVIWEDLAKKKKLLDSTCNMHVFQINIIKSILGNDFDEKKNFFYSVTTERKFTSDTQNGKSIREYANTDEKVSGTCQTKFNKIILMFSQECDENPQNSPRNECAEQYSVKLNEPCSSEATAVGNDTNASNTWETTSHKEASADPTDHTQGEYQGEVGDVLKKDLTVTPQTASNRCRSHFETSATECESSESTQSSNDEREKCSANLGPAGRGSQEDNHAGISSATTAQCFAERTEITANNVESCLPLDGATENNFRTTDEKDADVETEGVKTLSVSRATRMETSHKETQTESLCLDTKAVDTQPSCTDINDDWSHGSSPPTMTITEQTQAAGLPESFGNGTVSEHSEKELHIRTKEPESNGGSDMEASSERTNTESDSDADSVRNGDARGRNAEEDSKELFDRETCVHELKRIGLQAVSITDPPRCQIKEDTPADYDSDERIPHALTHDSRDQSAETSTRNILHEDACRNGTARGRSPGESDAFKTSSVPHGTGHRQRQADKETSYGTSQDAEETQTRHDTGLTSEEIQNEVQTFKARSSENSTADREGEYSPCDSEREATSAGCSEKDGSKHPGIAEKASTNNSPDTRREPVQRARSSMVDYPSGEEAPVRLLVDPSSPKHKSVSFSSGQFESVSATEDISLTVSRPAKSQCRGKFTIKMRVTEDGSRRNSLQRKRNGGEYRDLHSKRSSTGSKSERFENGLDEMSETKLEQLDLPASTTQRDDTAEHAFSQRQGATESPATRLSNRKLNAKELHILCELTLSSVRTFHTAVTFPFFPPEFVPTGRPLLHLESMRLATFHGYPHGDSQSVVRLANAGFYYPGDGDILACYSCGKTFSYADRHLNEDPYVIHRDLNPYCPHVLGEERRHLFIQDEQRLAQSGRDITGGSSQLLLPLPLHQQVATAKQDLVESIARFFRESADALTSSQGDGRAPDSSSRDVESVQVNGHGTMAPEAEESPRDEDQRSRNRDNTDPVESGRETNATSAKDGQRSDFLTVPGASATEVVTVVSREADTRSNLAAVSTHLSVPGAFQRSLSSGDSGYSSASPPPSGVANEGAQERAMRADFSLTPADRTAAPQGSLRDSNASQSASCPNETESSQQRPTEPSETSALSSPATQAPDVSAAVMVQRSHPSVRTVAQSHQTQVPARNATVVQQSTSGFMSATQSGTSSGSQLGSSGRPTISSSSSPDPSAVSSIGRTSQSFAPPVHQTFEATPTVRQSREATPPDAASHAPSETDYDPSRAVHRQYKELQRRLESFARWPDTHAQSPEELAIAGFFYTGHGDCVRCHYCALGLKHWDPDDSALDEHVRWRSSCSYLRALCGDVVIFKTLARIGAARGDDSPPSSESTESVVAGLVRQVSGLGGQVASSRRAADSNFSREADDLMTSRAAQTARVMGFSDDVIRHGIIALLGKPAGLSGLTSLTLCHAILLTSERGQRQVEDPETATEDPTDDDIDDESRGTSVINDKVSSPGSRGTMNSKNPSSLLGVHKGHSAWTEGNRGGQLQVYRVAAAPSLPLTSSQSAGPPPGSANSSTMSSSSSSSSATATASVSSFGGSSSSGYSSASTSSSGAASSAQSSLGSSMRPVGRQADAESAQRLLRTLEEENQELRERRRCKICLDNDISILFLPCGHLVCCPECAPALRRCPMCRKRITGSVHTKCATHLPVDNGRESRGTAGGGGRR